MFCKSALAQNTVNITFANADSSIHYYANAVMKEDAQRYDRWTFQSQKLCSKDEYIKLLKGIKSDNKISKFKINNIEGDLNNPQFKRYMVRYSYANNDTSTTYYTLKEENGDWRIAYNNLRKTDAQKENKLSNFKKAIEMYKEALTINPFDADCYDKIAWCYYNLKLADSSISNLLISENVKQSIKYEPENSEHYCTMAMYFSSVNNNILSIQFYEKAKKYTKDIRYISEINSNIANLYYALNDSVKSLEYAMRSVSEDSTQSFAFYILGKLKFNSKNYSDALLNFDKALFLKKLADITLCDIYSKYSESSFHLNNCENTRKYFYKAVELNPNMNWNPEYVKQIESCK